jgi:hypothetical protein
VPVFHVVVAEDGLELGGAAEHRCERLEDRGRQARRITGRVDVVAQEEQGVILETGSSVGS